ncbi:DUF4249 family protein [Porphyromonas pogonae]|uniref:DUF4249 family protein n=1 Tax=Porphyromonas pogonae TaxID=867595 RepID=UPI002E789A10|nr:DUF4249 family protein [Porphyromonas pogonae]
MASCIDYSKVDLKKTDQNKVEVLAEFSLGKPIRMYINSEKVPYDSKVKTVYIEDRDGNVLTELKNTEKHIWESKYHLEYPSLYFLRIVCNNEYIINKFEIPPKIKVKDSISFYLDYEFFNAFITFEDNITNDEYYIIEFPYNLKSGKQSLMSIQCLDEYSDNILYNEIKPPYKRIFVKRTHIHRPKELLFNIDYSNYDERDSLSLRIRRVEKEFYDYLYSYEIQKTSPENSAILSPQNPMFLGIIGGTSTYESKIKLSLPPNK